VFTEVVEGVFTAAKIYDERKTIAQKTRRWLRKLLSGTSRVGVLGAGGTGKTTLGLFLQGKLDADDAAAAYDETLDIERVQVAGDIPALLTVAPGQATRRPYTWPEIYRELASGRSSRIVNVVAWGHHSTMLELTAHRVYSPEQTEDEFRLAYLEDSRQMEILAIQELAPHLIATPGRLKMITLVTKQDLWWHQRQAAKRFYENGAYEQVITTIRSQMGRNFRHEYLSCALLEQNLRTADDFMIAPTAQGYDDACRVANLSRVASALERMIDT